MQQVKFKKGSMSEARFGNKNKMYLVSVDGDYSQVTLDPEASPCLTRCVTTIELEAVEPVVMLPIRKLTDEYIRAMWLDSGGSFHGPITETASMTETNLVKFVRGLL